MGAEFLTTKTNEPTQAHNQGEAMAMCRLQMSNMMASLPLAGLKPCPRRWLIRAEEGRRGGAADSQTGGVERGGRCHSGRRGARLKSFHNKGHSASVEDISSWCYLLLLNHHVTQRTGAIRAALTLVPKYRLINVATLQPGELCCFHLYY